MNNAEPTNRQSEKNIVQAEKLAEKQKLENLMENTFFQDEGTAEYLRRIKAYLDNLILNDF